jgi:hypothetical protein
MTTQARGQLITELTPQRNPIRDISSETHPVPRHKLEIAGIPVPVEPLTERERAIFLSGVRFGYETAVQRTLEALMDELGNQPVRSLQYLVERRNERSAA